ncbi:hypothetical protein HHI36_015275 [Cryptolaemus montrouzieri]|uniref:Uncharacterized protein n=1 Tax=Cryptolaemus montrouzieri TaxID=559131 RepID=A0ABD2N5L0_9CUCU
MNSAEKIPADVAFLNAPTERLEGMLLNIIAALTARGNNISDILQPLIMPFFLIPGNRATTKAAKRRTSNYRGNPKNVEDRDQKPVREHDGRGHRRGPPPDGRGRQAS